MSEPKSKFARRYDREFKEDTVALVLKGRSQGEVSRDLGVSAWSLGEWVRQAKAGHALSHPKTLEAESAEQRELRRLRAENDCLRQEEGNSGGRQGGRADSRHPHKIAENWLAKVPAPERPGMVCQRPSALPPSGKDSAFWLSRSARLAERLYLYRNRRGGGRE